jgi:hypothetical protein
MATKKTSKRGRSKKATSSGKDFKIFGPCCSGGLDLVLTGTVFSAEINGAKFDNVRKISLTSRDPMMVLGLSKKGLFRNFKPWRVYIAKGKVGQILSVKDGKVILKAKKKTTKKDKRKKTK